MKHKIYISFLLLFCTTACFCQGYKYIYYLDKDLASTNKKNSLFVGKGRVEYNAFTLDCFNKDDDHLIMTIQFADSTLNKMNGSFTSFYKNGIVENEGTYINNQEEGVWIKKDTAGLITDSSQYKNGIKYSYSKISYHKNKNISTYQFTDSLKNSYQYISYDSIGAINADANFIGNNGVYNKYDSGKVKITNVYTRELKEAECKLFSKHLLQNLNANIGVENAAKPGVYQIVIKFIVNIDGSVSNIEAETKCGHKMEEEGIRVIKISPKWEIATMFGIPVKAYRRQPITFVVGKDG